MCVSEFVCVNIFFALFWSVILYRYPDAIKPQHYLTYAYDMKDIDIWLMQSIERRQMQGQLASEDFSVIQGTLNIYKEVSDRHLMNVICQS